MELKKHIDGTINLPKAITSLLVSLVASVALLVLSSCAGSQSSSSTAPSSSSTVPPSTSPSTTATTSPPATSTTSPPPTGTTFPTIPPAPSIPSLTPPSALIRNRTALSGTEYVVFAWNDLGMHCANPTYDKLVILPPYNNLWVQVIKRGDPPQIVTSGLTVEYSVLNNTYSYGKQDFGQFWDNAQKLFGVDLLGNIGLNLSDPNVHNGLSGTMAARGDYFEAMGIPLTPINDDGSWNPYQVGQVVVKDASGKVVAQTDTTLPISDELECGKCHGADPFQNILETHDGNIGTNLVSQEPVLCASCHGDPALGVAKGNTKYLSDAVHGFHSTVSPQPACYDCHPGLVTKCSRSLAHTAADGNCVTCHGDLAQVAPFRPRFVQ